MSPHPKKNILFLEYQLILQDVVEVLQNRGHRLHGMHPRSITVKHFIQTCRKHQIDWVFAINFSPEIAFLCGKIGIPYVSWTIDPLSLNRYRIIDETIHELCVCFAHDILTVQKFRDLGFPAQHMLLAAPDLRRQPISQKDLKSKYLCDASFVGSSMINEVVELENYLHSLEKDLIVTRKKTKRDVLKWIKTMTLQHVTDPKYHGLKSLGGWSFVPKELQDLEISERQRQDILFHIDGSLAALHRQQAIYSLRKSSFELRVWGDKHWCKIHPNYQHRAEHNQELTHIYCASGINIDIPRLYQRNTINMRVFDVLAAGGFVLTEKSDALQNVFTEGQHVGLYTSQKELEDKLQWWLHHPKERQQIAKQGREEVLQKHLISHRVDSILQYVEETFFQNEHT
jgi:spore maturation protein CgeB